MAPLLLTSGWFLRLCLADFSIIWARTKLALGRRDHPPQSASFACPHTPFGLEDKHFPDLASGCGVKIFPSPAAAAPPIRLSGCFQDEVLPVRRPVDPFAACGAGEVTLRAPATMPCGSPFCSRSF